MQRIKMIDAADIRRVLQAERLIPVIEKSLQAFSRGPTHPEGAIQPLRSSVDIAKHSGQLMLMPGYLLAEDALATKILTLYPNNAALGIATQSAVVILMDPKNGRILAFLEGDTVTELRTAASSAVASKYLAPENVTKVAVLGSGIQGASHARIHHYLYNPKELRIWSRQECNAVKLVDALRLEGISSAVAASSVEDAVKDADIINTCTLSTEHILKANYVKEGAHINAVGAPRPDWRELDDGIMLNSVIYADSREAAMNEAGDVIQCKADVFAEIGEVINGEKLAHREKTTVYKSLGLAVLDVAAARLAYDLLN